MRLPALRNASPIAYALLVKPTQAKSIFRQYFVVSITKEKPCLVNRHWCSNPQISVMGLSQSNDSHAKASQLIQNTIEGNCVVIFSKTTCNFCSMAKRLFRDLGVNYVAVELDRIEDGSQLQQVLSSRTGITTVPQVFINGQTIGGATETRKLHQQGELLPLLQQCQRLYTKAGTIYTSAKPPQLKSDL